jgi:hypothetical protein
MSGSERGRVGMRSELDEMRALPERLFWAIPSIPWDIDRLDHAVPPSSAWLLRR